ncbi:TetR/AcrR family transcriptional regulator [Entomomonas asaccharolytica]|uniref:TetR/AcrR family transcriptional regulator n=1 Tax=Entomomonas asaccharolytica TaxID=2785331 RepID=A0A974NH71_9GAMM|nr:TetR/AcrR family transcriptional regulator [Entomomonas asaccharolytica]QQP86297.1 TetR/AcrR family transcriptional regulator [Entomomonas asaccharolytica]
MKASDKTIERIYNAAEQLFAERGFTETSLRSITAEAEVNLAAVNYHFGSKEGLIKAIFSRYLTQFCSELEKKLDYYESKQNATPSTEELLSIFMELIVSIKTHSSKGVVTFMRLFSNALLQKQLFLHEYMTNDFGIVFYRFGLMLRKAAHNDNISEVEWFWRLHFSLGTILLNIASMEYFKTLMKKEFKTSIKISQVIQLMAPYITAGLLAAPVLKDETLVNAKYDISKLTEN